MNERRWEQQSSLIDQDLYAALQRLISEKYRQFDAPRKSIKEAIPTIVEKQDDSLTAAKRQLAQLQQFMQNLTNVKSMMEKIGFADSTLRAKGLVLSSLLLTTNNERKEEIVKLEALLEPFQKAPQLIQSLLNDDRDAVYYQTAKEMVMRLGQQSGEGEKKLQGEYLAAIQHYIKAIVDRFCAEINVLSEHQAMLPPEKIDSALRVLLLINDEGRFGKRLAIPLDAHLTLQMTEEMPRMAADTYFRLRRATVLGAFKALVQETRNDSRGWSLLDFFVRVHQMLVDEESLKDQLLPWIPTEWWEIFGETLLLPILAYFRPIIDAAENVESFTAALQSLDPLTL